MFKFTKASKLHVASNSSSSEKTCINSLATRADLLRWIYASKRALRLEHRSRSVCNFSQHCCPSLVFLIDFSLSAVCHGWIANLYLSHSIYVCSLPCENVTERPKDHGRQHSSRMLCLLRRRAERKKTHFWEKGKKVYSLIKWWWRWKMMLALLCMLFCLEHKEEK